MAGALKSERVLVRVAGTAPDDWRGDELRFTLGSREAYARGHDLESGYRHIVDWRIVASEDPPTHAYRDGVLVALQDVAPPGFAPCDPPPREISFVHLMSVLFCAAAFATLMTILFRP